jgi:hypothetical protein
MQVIHGYLCQTQNLGAKIQLQYSEVRYLQKSSVERPYVTAGVVIAPLPPTELGVGVETAGE